MTPDFPPAGSEGAPAEVTGAPSSLAQLAAVSPLDDTPATRGDLASVLAEVARIADTIDAIAAGANQLGEMVKEQGVAGLVGAFLSRG